MISVLEFGNGSRTRNVNGHGINQIMNHRALVTSGGGDLCAKGRFTYSQYVVHKYFVRVVIIQSKHFCLLDFHLRI